MIVKRLFRAKKTEKPFAFPRRVFVFLHRVEEDFSVLGSPDSDPLFQALRLGTISAGNHSGHGGIARVQTAAHVRRFSLTSKTTYDEKAAATCIAAAFLSAEGSSTNKTTAVSGGRFIGFDHRVEEMSVLGRPGSDLLFQALRLSTIGAGEFNGRVRDGIGFRPPANTTRSAKDGIRDQLSGISMTHNGLTRDFRSKQDGYFRQWDQSQRPA